MNIGVVIPVGPGRRSNVDRVLDSLYGQVGLSRDKLPVILVCDGEQAFVECSAIKGPRRRLAVRTVGMDKHTLGKPPPRNVGVEVLRGAFPDVSWVWFVDSDVEMEPAAYCAFREAIEIDEAPRVLCGQYDWRAPDGGVGMAEYRADMFSEYSPAETLRYHLGAALANFSGNLVWPIEEFERVGGFHSNLTAGRVDDGELGVRASVHGVGTSFVRDAIGHHIWHPVDTQRTAEINAREVPLINEWYPFIQQQGIILKPEDGVRLEMLCSECGETVNTLKMWGHVLGHRGDACFIPLRDRDGDLKGRAVVSRKDLPLFTRFRWALSANGYAYRKTSLGSRGETTQRAFYMHREVLGVSGDPLVEGDHINGDRLDNRPENLRVLPADSANAQNIHFTNRGTSKFRGVCWASGAWCATSTKDGEQVWIGRFQDEVAAARAVQAWRDENMPYAEPDLELVALDEGETG
jgi:hypothetical protein